MTEKLLLKDSLFNAAKIERMAREIRQVYPAFASKQFVQECVARFPELELKARITWIAECLKTYLPRDYAQAVGVLAAALPPPCDPSLADDDFGEFIYAPYNEFIAKNGCTKTELKRSLAALYEITQRFSAEDAIRYFLNAFPMETMHALEKWVRDPHYHVRRLCSEGTRPRLPWSQKISLPPAATLPLLDILHSDPTRYVTRSVANHLNDLSRVDPALVLETLAKWRKAGKQRPDEIAFIVRHGLRGLVKQGNPDALRMLGFDATPHIRVTKLRAPKEVNMDTALEFSFSLVADHDAKVLIDYVMHFQNKAGLMQGRKVYKLCKATLAAGVPLEISKGHLLRQNMTTRKLYPGRHEIEIQVNGRICARAAFDLRRPAR